MIPNSVVNNQDLSGARLLSSGNRMRELDKFLLLNRKYGRHYREDRKDLDFHRLLYGHPRKFPISPGIANFQSCIPLKLLLRHDITVGHSWEDFATRQLSYITICHAKDKIRCEICADISLEYVDLSQ